MQRILLAHPILIRDSLSILANTQHLTYRFHSVFSFQFSVFSFQFQFRVKYELKTENWFSEES
jgi:hypothetical protein